MSCSKPEKFFPAVKTLCLPAGTFKGRVAFITGGGTGLGKAMATALSALGATVAIASRRLPLLETVASEISAQTGNQVVPIALNVKQPEDVARAVDECVARVGLPHLIVNNAAGNFIAASERLSPNAFRTIVDIVLMGSAYVSLDVGKRLIAAGQGGAFLSITTPYARTGSPFVVPSASAKAGVENLCKSLAAEWGKHGLRFNCIAPGPIYTEVLSAGGDGRADGRLQGAFSRLDPTGGGAGGLAQSLPAGRRGEPEELANLAAYMLSDYCSWMNGSIVDFDGGQNHLKSGAFSELHKVTAEQWDQVEGSIRQTTGKSKI